MSAQPAPQTARSSGWPAAVVLVVVAVGFVYFPLFKYSFKYWLTPDYSHGFLVPLFAAYVAWHRRALAPAELKWPEPWGLAFIAAGAGLYVAATLTNFAKEIVQGVSLVLNLCGATLLLGGWGGLRWLWPALGFLVFMFPLPYKVEHALGWELQKIAAVASEFVLQTIGYPTYREGVILHVKDHALGVEKACSGLSMLLTFVAMSVGIVMVVKRPWLDKVVILLSAVPVAVLSNVIRISLTGVLYNEAGKELGDKVFHDFAGWMMMPIALGVFWLELKILSWVLLEDLGKASREEVIKMNAKHPAHLFMYNFPDEARGGAKAPTTATPDPKAGTQPPGGR